MTTQAVPPLPSQDNPQNGNSGTPGASIAINPLQALLDRRKEAEWVGWVNSEYQKCKAARTNIERQWFINLAFAAGKQYVAPVVVPGQGFRLTAPRTPPWRVKLVINKIRTSLRTEHSKLCSNKPIPVVLPATSEDEDASAARVAESLLRAEFATAQFDHTYRSWIWWGAVTGTSFMKSYWDATYLDPDAQNPPEPHPLQEISQQPLPPVPAAPVYGKIKIERVTPFHVYVPDLLAEDLESQPYLIHVTTRNPLWVERTYGFKPTADSRASNTMLEAATLMTKGTNDHFDSVLVKEIWLKADAHPDFPEGGVLTIINDRCVQKVTQWPWPFKEFPFYKYDGIRTGGFYGDSVIVDLIPIQKEYNRTKSQIIEIKNTMGKPKLLYPKGSINPRQITSEPGQGIPYLPGFNPPTVLAPAEVPQTMVQELDQLRADFDDISGQHEITRGNTPSQVTSGTAISFLQEQDDSKLADQVASIEHGIQILGQHYLKYVTTYWSEKRMVKVVGRDNEYEAQHFKGSDLRGNTDVRVQTGSALPFSKAAKQALITEFMTNGWMEPQVGMEILEMGGFDRIVDEMLVDKRQAQRENLKMSELDPMQVSQLLEPPVNPQTGQPDYMPTDPNTPVDQQLTAELRTLDPEAPAQPWKPQPVIPVNSYDDHELHIHWHNQYRKTQQFELLPDPIKQAFELHVQAHQMALTMPQMGAAGLVANQELAPEGSSPASGIPQEDEPTEEGLEGTPSSGGEAAPPQ